MSRQRKPAAAQVDLFAPSAPLQVGDRVQLSDGGTAIVRATESPPTPENVQYAHVQRVGDKIQDHVIQFMLSRLGAQFHLVDLTSYVQRQEPQIAPDSPRRVLGELRAAGKVDYEVVSRQHSLYRCTKVKP